MITVILLTTIVPTALHLVVAALALVILLLKGDRLANLLQRMCDDTSATRGNMIDPLIAAIWISGYFLIAIGLLGVTGYLCARSIGLPFRHWFYEISRHVAAA